MLRRRDEDDLFAHHQGTHRSGGGRNDPFDHSEAGFGDGTGYGDGVEGNMATGGGEGIAVRMPLYFDNE